MAALGYRLRNRASERAELAEWVSAWIFVALLQGAIGYIQYFNEVPALLVGIHVFGATVAVVDHRRPRAAHAAGAAECRRGRACGAPRPPRCR